LQKIRTTSGNFVPFVGSFYHSLRKWTFAVS
jgi:hypothetical protein